MRVPWHVSTAVSLVSPRICPISPSPVQTFEPPHLNQCHCPSISRFTLMKKRRKMSKSPLFPPSMAPTFLLCFLFLLRNGLSDDTHNLLRFKSSLPNPQTLSNWRSGTNPCLFTGVSCHSSLSSPRVISLDLSFLPLSSDFNSVSTHLFLLDDLVSLKLTSTNLSGSFRPFSSCSSTLSQIDLSVNSISGSPSDFAFFSACPALSALNLSSNRIQTSTVAFTSKKYSLSLQSLDVSVNRLVGSDFLPWILSTGCAHLNFLSLRGNKLDGPFSLNGCLKLQHFDVSVNNFSIQMPELGGCQQLSYLELSSNKFAGLIGDHLVGCQNLTFLNLSNNQFSGPVPSLPSGRLQFLNLSGNHFEGGIRGSILEACASLVELDLSNNRLSGNLPTGLESCNSLQLLHVSSNNLSGDLLIHVLMKMNGLKKIDLSLNSFAGVLPDTLLLHTGLETLVLSSNQISGQIPYGLCEFEKTSLKELYLQNNLLSGPIPPDLANCSQLVSLDLSFNFLTGVIPPSLGFLTNLKDLILSVNSLQGIIPQEFMYLKSLENLILDYNKLTGDIPDGLRNCTELHWMSLSSNQLSGLIPSWIGGLDKLAILKLSNNSFSGNIPPELGDCKSLLWLDLHTNLLNGTIPPRLFNQSGHLENTFVVGGKEFAYLKNNGSKECHGDGNLIYFAGISDNSLGRIPNRHICNFTRVYKGITQPSFQHNGTMMFLGLSHNMLEGSIPKEIGSMSYLLILDLGHNTLSGPIPSELDGLQNVGVMDLSYNHLSGQMPPALAKLTMLTEIDFSNNNLTGMIPTSSQFDTFPASKFENNSGLCGYPLASCTSEISESGLRHRSRQKQGTLIGSVVVELLFSLFCIFGVIVVFVELRKRRKKLDSSLGEHGDGNSHSNSGSRQNTGWKLTTREALSINLATFETPLWKLTFADLLEATNGFHSDAMIGSGGFGDVYKAKLKDGSIVALKKLKHVSGQGDREFKAEMETIGKVKHTNLVSLLGYCKVGDERILVYEYMQHGSLEDVLHDRKKAGIKLSWAQRRRIADGAARGLAFLHSCSPCIIHRDMKSSNVLLDEHLEARVSDFGMARLMSAMDTHLSVSTLAGTPGYVPPEYYQSFRCSTKGDVYSYGVVLLELLTGRQPTDSADFGDNNLVGWVRQHAKTRISDVFDPELIKEDPSLEIELLQHLKVACACLDDRPRKRPTIIQVIAMFKDIQAGSGMDKSKSTIAADDGCFIVTESFSTVDS